jgi:mannose/cellobiose epimerase-like protein (N-acyl-D-glucosamine 2-epimerase family)
LAIRTIDLRRHLLEELLPLWCEHGVDRERGGFHPKLTLGLRPGDDDFKRLVATARQIYAFSHAALLGAPGWALATAHHGLEFMNDSFWDGRHEGWFLTTDLEGSPLDRRKDTYAHAFVLFAMAYYFRATGDGEALRIAERTVNLLEHHLADAVNGGFFEGATESWEPVSEPRRQNPHMHLFEGFLALYQVTRESRYLEQAGGMARLFQSRFLDPRLGCLGEYFTGDWRQHPGDLGEVLEPGHHFEWVWLLHQYARESGEETILEDADRLFRFASRFGVDEDNGGVYDEIDRQGQAVRDTKRLWPQTELIKALVVRYASSRDESVLEALDQVLRHCFSLYVDPRHRGWRDHLTRTGEILTELMPATSIYHITLALSEVIRLLDGKPAGGAVRPMAGID